MQYFGGGDSDSSESTVDGLIVLDLIVIGDVALPVNEKDDARPSIAKLLIHISTRTYLNTCFLFLSKLVKNVSKCVLIYCKANSTNMLL